MIIEPDRIVELAWRQVWQVTLVAAVAALIMRWGCRRRPHLAYLLGLVVLAKCWMPPVWSSRGGVFSWPPTITAGATAPAKPSDEPEPIDTIRPAAVSLTPEFTPPADSSVETFAPSPPLTSPDASPRTLALMAPVSLWLAGVMVWGMVAGIRYRRWRRGIFAEAVRYETRLQRCIDDIARRLGLRRPPRLVVTTSPTGPAVFGLLRPTIVLPQRLAECDQATLELVLAHEILHVRRGDLYFGLFQFATLVVWWFHPLVWWIGRQLTRERERSCDEAVLALTRCPPASYAQCLLHILRFKRQLPALAAFPGIRAIEVTQQRMEHIMQSNVAARRRTPMRYWFIAAATLGLVLPGERFTIAEQEESEPRGASKPEFTPEDGPNSADDPSKTIEEETKPGAPDAAAITDEAPTAVTGNNEGRTQIEQAIDRGIAFLKLQQLEDGHWTDPVGYPGGITSICTLALLKSGVKPDEQAAKSAIEYLKLIKPTMTYSTVLQTLVFCAANQPGDRRLIERNVEWLAKQQKQEGQMRGAWGYPQAEGDNSNTGFAVLALFAADRVGIHAATATWRRTLSYWLKNQNDDGSWGYKPEIAGTGSMTSQGLFCVTAAARALAEDNPDQPAAHSVKKAKAWLTSNFAVQMNPGLPGQQGWRFYYLLALARAASLSGIEEFGERNWYAEASKLLLEVQNDNGSWKGTGHAEDDPHLATSMAILFLLEGREDKR